MTRLPRPFQARSRSVARRAIVAVAGFAAATVVGVALAGTFTVKVAKSATVTDQAGSMSRETIAVTPHGFAVYELTGDSRQHPECTNANGCFSIWPPVKVASVKNLSKAPGIRGQLGVWRRNGFFQVTLGGHPLYRYAPDSQMDTATGQGIQSFGGTWHVVKASSGR